MVVRKTTIPLKERFARALTRESRLRNRKFRNDVSAGDMTPSKTKDSTSHLDLLSG